MYIKRSDLAVNVTSELFIAQSWAATSRRGKSRTSFQNVQALLRAEVSACKNSLQIVAFSFHTLLHSFYDLEVTAISASFNCCS